MLTRKALGRPRILQAALPGQEDVAARLLTVAVPGLVLSSIYAPAGNPVRNGKAQAIAIRAAWLKGLREHVEERLDASKRIVLCGDFNVSHLSNGEGQAAIGAVVAGRDSRTFIDTGIRTGRVTPTGSIFTSHRSPASAAYSAHTVSPRLSNVPGLTSTTETRSPATVAGYGRGARP